MHEMVLTITTTVPSPDTSPTEVVTSGVSSVSNACFRNIDRKIFVSLLIPAA